MVFEQVRECTECHQNLPTTAFYRKGERLYARCKPCVSVDRKRHYESKRIVKPQGLIHIYVQRFYGQLEANKGDLLAMVEAFLFEECANEQ